MSQLYTDKKKEFDDIVYGYLVKRLITPIPDTDAYHTAHVDELGNELKPTDDWSYTKLDRLVFDLKSILKDRVNQLDQSFKAVDAYALMNSPVDTKNYLDKYHGILSIIEEAAYIPPELRGQANETNDTSELPMTDRISFALSIASFLLYAAKLSRFPNETEVDHEVLPSTESTFGVRSLGSLPEFIEYARNAKITDGRGLNNNGYVLLVRAARKIVNDSLLIENSDKMYNQSAGWRAISNA